MFTVKKGDKVKCLLTGIFSGIQIINKILTVSVGGTGQTNPIRCFVQGQTGAQLSLYSGQFERASVTVTDYQKEIDEHQKEINELKLRIEWMLKNKIDEFDKDTFKIWKILRLVETSKSDVEKAKLIAELVNS